MGRFGKILIGLLILAGIAFASMVRFVPGGRDVQEKAQAPLPEEPPGTVLIPVQGVRAADLIDSFADPRGDGTRRHDAIDILAPRGTPVLAAAPGMVEKLFESRLGGHTLYIRSPDRRRLYYYAHLDGYAPGLTEGQAIAAGQGIGFVGTTGDADPGAPHLHFEVQQVAPREGWWQGRSIDPYPLLAGKLPSR